MKTSNSKVTGAGLLVLLVMVCLFSRGIDAQKAQRASKKMLAQANSAKVSEKALNTFGWTGDNKTYQSLRSAIDKQINKGASPFALARQYQKLSQPKVLVGLRPEWWQTAGVSLQDSKAVFRWAYSARLAALASKPYDEALLGKPYQAMLHLNGFKTEMQAYDFARLYFLIACHVLPEASDSVVDLGDRLYHSNPQDNSVRYLLIYVLMRPESPSSTNKALAYASAWVKQSPASPDANVLLGGAYNTRWIQTHSVGDANRAIKAFSKYLLLDPGSGSAAHIRYEIATLQKYK